MKKRYLALGLATLMTMVSTHGPGLSSARAATSEPSRQELMDEVKQLREIVEKLNSRLTDTEKKLEASSDAKVEEKMTKVDDMLDELDSRVGVTERHSVMDKITLSVDLRSEVTSMHYQDARVLEEWNQSMLSLWAFDRLATPFPVGTPSTAGGNTANGRDVTGDNVTDYTFNTDFVSAYGSKMMPLMPDMFMDGMFSGFYLPSAVPGFGLAAGDFVSRARAGQMMGGAGLDPTNRNDVITFFGMFTAAAPDAQAVIASSDAGAGIPLFSKQFTAGELASYQDLFNSIDPQEQDIDNDAIWTSRIRVDMHGDPAPNLTFGGRLSANKVWGDSSGVKWYSGDMSSVAMDGNIHQKGSDSAIRLERGFVTYRDEAASAPWHFSLGRRPALDGAPWEVSQHTVVGGSPLAHAINWQFDGASLGFDLSKQVGIEGFNFKLCYGSGFESGIGSGNSYAMDYSNDVDDTSFLGYILRLYEKGDTKLVNMYAHAFDVTDGFTGLVAMPFAIAGVDANGDNAYDTYFLDANKGGYVSRMEAFTNIGDIDLLTLLYQTKVSGVDLFLDLAGNYARPSNISMNPMMQFMGTDGLLNSNGESKDRTGYSVWAGVKVPIPKTEGALGFEWNWGSKYWFGFNGGEDTLNTSKLATRGHVFDTFYHQPLIGKKFLLTVGGQYYVYDYNLSGNPMGEPTKIEDITALDALMPVPDTMWNTYANLIYHW